MVGRNKYEETITDKISSCSVVPQRVLYQCTRKEVWKKKKTPAVPEPDSDSRRAGKRELIVAPFV